MNVTNTERLSFSFITEDDIDDLFELDSDPAVMKYLTNGKTPERESYHDTFYNRLNKYAQRTKGWGLWKVTIRDSQQFIGWVLARPLDFFSDEPKLHNIELGWRFKQCAWGKGYATEAANAVALAFNTQPDITTVSAIAVPDNIGSIRVMERLGMTFVKNFIHKDPIGDIEAVYYEMPIANLK